MSSLLEQAIVDAKALKEAAMKNAEATIIDKYSEEVKSTLNQLLEQDELGALLGGDEPSADAEGAMEEEVKADEIAEGVPDAFTEDVAELDGVNEGDETEVTVDFAELAEALKQLREGVEEELEESNCSPATDEEPMDEELELDEESIMEMVASMLSEEDEEELEEGYEDQPHPYDRHDDPFKMAMAKRRRKRDAEERVKRGREEDFYNQGKPYREGKEEDEDLYEELSDDMLDAIMEKLTVDMGATLSGWAGRSSEDMKHQMELEMAHRRSTEVAEELEALKKAQEELVFENKKLKENLSNYQDVVNSLKENVQDVNLSNARLLYTNRTLRNSSLNERQKERIVEAISKAGSVEEAKTIHETLQSTVASTPARGPQSLSEAITRPTSIIRASRKEEPTADPFQARMRKLAGLE
jgi:FtsZ-binding cell division protein ZapB